jgi:iron complex outermembrane receptor protein
VIFDRVAQGNLTVLPPKSKIALGDTWSWGDFSLISHLTRYGSYTIRQTAAASDRNFNAKWVEDLELDWQATSSLGLAVGADDLFNTYPSANGLFNTATGSQQYGGSPPSPFGFTGGYYYGRVSIKL